MTIQEEEVVSEGGWSHERKHFICQSLVAGILHGWEAQLNCCSRRERALAIYAAVSAALSAALYCNVLQCDVQRHITHRVSLGRIF